jgi:Uncharacterized protein conserved in bacteria
MILGAPPSALLAARCEAIPPGTRQCWVATPFHGLPVRDRVRVMPEGSFPWDAEDADWLCGVVNPLLREEGMELCTVGAALVMACRRPLQANPAGFGEVSGAFLPCRHAGGRDGGRLARLLAEVQMLLFQHPSLRRRRRGEVDVSGLWLWGPSPWPREDVPPARPVHTRNPFLQALSPPGPARLAISETARMRELRPTGARLPGTVILAGGGFAVVLEKRRLPWPGRSTWRPYKPGPEAALLPLLAYP